MRLRHAQLPEEARDLDKELRALLKEKDAAVRSDFPQMLNVLIAVMHKHTCAVLSHVFLSARPVSCAVPDVAESEAAFSRHMLCIRR